MVMKPNELIHSWTDMLPVLLEKACADARLIVFSLVLTQLGLFSHLHISWLVCRNNGLM